MRKIWPFSFYFIFFAGVAFASPFFVLYYLELGFSGAQIGLLTGINPLIVFFSAPLWAGIADATNKHRLLMSLAIVLGAIFLFIFPYLQVFLPVFLIASVLFFFLAPITPFADSATLYMLADERDLYSRIRLGGTLGFGLAAFFAGVLVQRYDLRVAFWGSACLLLILFFLSQKLEYGRSSTTNLARGRVVALLKDPRWSLFLVLAFAGGVNSAAINNYLFPFMKEMGASESMMGFALLVGMFSEIPALFFGNRLIKKFKPYGLLMLSMVISGIRMLLFAASQTPSSILVIQLLNGLTFPIMWVAGVSYANEHAPEGMSTIAQGLFSAMVIGIGMAAGGFAGGMLLDAAGGHMVYLILGATVLIISAFVAVMHRRLPPEEATSLSTAAP